MLGRIGQLAGCDGGLVRNAGRALLICKLGVDDYG